MRILKICTDSRLNVQDNILYCIIAYTQTYLVLMIILVARTKKFFFLVSKHARAKCVEQVDSPDLSPNHKICPLVLTSDLISVGQMFSKRRKYLPKSSEE